MNTSSKSAYHAPTLQALGAVKDLTKAATGSGMDGTLLQMMAA